MREVLFRGKTKQDDWVYGQYCELTDGKRIISCIYYKGEIIKKTLGQYTGLTDRNEKKIFEGDIVEYKDEYGKIVYHDNEAMFVIEFDTWCTDFDHITGNEIEVIGNIHDNPELLKGGAE